MSGDDSDNDDNVTGYGRPPKEHQFKKGHSGNERGRPRKVVAEKAPDSHWGTSLYATGRIAYEPVPVTLNGKKTTIPAIEALHRRRLNDALKGGNRLLQREVIADADAHEKQELKREVERYLELQKAKADGEALVAQARAKGLPEPVLIPHPDDIIIDEYQTTATIDGPDTHEGLAVTNHILAVREHLVIRAAYQRQFPPLLSPFTEAHFEGLRSTAHTINEALCKRLRWGPSGF